MSTWQYRLAFLAWENTETGELSTTHPSEGITPIDSSKKEMQQVHNELPILSEAVAYRALFGSDDGKVKRALQLSRKEQPEVAIDRAVKNSRGFGKQEG